MASALLDALAQENLRGVSVSIDDFYLTHAEQNALAARHEGNPYLRYRGYPGTHDVPLGTRTIESLAKLREGEETPVVSYDKSAHQGRGDRAPESEWRRVAGRIDVLVVEGWMLGFAPVPAAEIEADLRAPNAYLAAYAAWVAKLDSFVQLHVESLDAIVRWRVDAERARRAQGRPALSDEEARDYIERFLPAYRVYVPPLRARPPCEDVKTVVLGEDRNPLAGT